MTWAGDDRLILGGLPYLIDRGALYAGGEATISLSLRPETPATFSRNKFGLTYEGQSIVYRLGRCDGDL